MTGLDHVTAIASNAAVNLAFYRDILGLRLVKQTVSFDDPGSHHLCFSNGSGSPGAILIFFPHPHAPPGGFGVGQVDETMFAVPEASIGSSTERFIAHGVDVTTPENRLDETVLPFQDRDRMRLALVALAAANPYPASMGGAGGSARGGRSHARPHGCGVGASHCVPRGERFRSGRHG
jgi:glyoxalase family protein